MDKQMRMSGIGKVQEPDIHENHARQICEEIRGEVEERAGRKFREFTAIGYKVQLVNGVNYYIKVRVNDDQYIHIRAFKSFSGEVSYSNHEDNKTLDEEIIFFEKKADNLEEKRHFEDE